MEQSFWDHLNTVGLFILSFLSGLITAVWKLFSVIGKVSTLETRINDLEKDYATAKEEMKRLEDRLFSKLETIELKLDNFILKQISK